MAAEGTFITGEVREPVERYEPIDCGRMHVPGSAHAGGSFRPVEPGLTLRGSMPTWGLLESQTESAGKPTTTGFALFDCYGRTFKLATPVASSHDESPFPKSRI